jgi:3-oxoadipate enol-lactonase
MYCCGEEDGAANPDYMRPMHETTPGSKFEAIEDAGHISNMENPPRFNAIMTGFLESL